MLLYNDIPPQGVVGKAKSAEGKTNIHLRDRSQRSSAKEDKNWTWKDLNNLNIRDQVI